MGYSSLEVGSFSRLFIQRNDETVHCSNGGGGGVMVCVLKKGKFLS